MPDWQSPAELQKEGLIFTKFIHSLLGLYAYEWFISLSFELDFIRGVKKFRWPMIFYFANRYLLLFALIGIAVSLDATTEINCQTVYTFNQIAGDAAIGLASINLSIRTMAIWAQNRYIIGFLVIIILGHWSLILQGVQLKAVWIPGTGCVITETNNRILAAIFIYSMCFDLFVLLLNTYKLAGSNGPATERVIGRSRLAQLIFTDGLIFFFIAFVANLLATVFMVLNLNQIMSVIFNVPAAVFSTIVACRAVRRLTSFTQKGPEVYSSSQSGQINFRAPNTGMANRGMTSRHVPKGGIGAQSGVHVQMETFTRAEEGLDNDVYDGSEPKKHCGESETDTEIDLEKKGAL